MNSRVSVEMKYYSEANCCDTVGFSAKVGITDETISFSRDEFKDLMDNILTENHNGATMTHWQIIIEP